MIIKNQPPAIEIQKIVLGDDGRTLSVVVVFGGMGKVEIRNTKEGQEFYLSDNLSGESTVVKISKEEVLMLASKWENVRYMQKLVTEAAQQEFGISDKLKGLMNTFEV